jgi:hypothetical protein
MNVDPMVMEIFEADRNLSVNASRVTTSSRLFNSGSMVEAGSQMTPPRFAPQELDEPLARSQVCISQTIGTQARECKDLSKHPEVTCKWKVLQMEPAVFVPRSALEYPFKADKTKLRHLSRVFKRGLLANV